MPIFLPTIPQATDQLSISQGNILTNFTILGAIAGNGNAASSSINSSSGFNWVYLPTQGSSIPPAGAAFPAGNIGLYSATNSTTTLNELYINKYINLPSANTTVQIPITAFGNGTISSSPATAASWAYFPSGMLQISGQVTGSGNITITFANGSANGVAGFPGFSNYISSIQVTRVDASGTVNNFPIVRSYSLTGCVVSLSNGGSGTIFWTATGI